MEFGRRHNLPRPSSGNRSGVDIYGNRSSELQSAALGKSQKGRSLSASQSRTLLSLLSAVEKPKKALHLMAIQGDRESIIVATDVEDTTFFGSGAGHCNLRNPGHAGHDSGLKADSIPE